VGFPHRYPPGTRHGFVGSAGTYFLIHRHAASDGPILLTDPLPRRGYLHRREFGHVHPYCGALLA